MTDKERVAVVLGKHFFEPTLTVHNLYIYG
jgi:hypothetical protein